MGKVLSVISRKARRFNAENRAHRYLDKEKLPSAPKFQSNVEDYQRVLEENPNFAQHESKKHVDLDDRLKQVYVTSTDPVVPNVAQDASETIKPLPLDRKAAEEYEFGYLEPAKVSRGRATLRQALAFISNHQNEPKVWTSDKISEDYKLKPSVVDSILKHFHTFDVYIPDIKSTDKILLKDRMKDLWDDKPKSLPPPTYESDEVFNRLLKEHDQNEGKKKDEKEEKKEEKKV